MKNPVAAPWNQPERRGAEFYPRIGADGIPFIARDSKGSTIPRISRMSLWRSPGPIIPTPYKWVLAERVPPCSTTSEST